MCGLEYFFKNYIHKYIFVVLLTFDAFTEKSQKTHNVRNCTCGLFLRYRRLSLFRAQNYIHDLYIV